MNTCINGDGNPVENADTQECASCGAARRKAERRKSVIKTPIKKMSDKKRNEVDQYIPLRDAFLLRKWCKVHGKPCIPTQVHHMKGKVGFADDEAREKNIPLLIDIRFWIPVCQVAHDWITEHSSEAIEQGYSILRSI